MSEWLLINGDQCRMSLHAKNVNQRNASAPVVVLTNNLLQVDDCSDCEDEDCSPLGLLYCDLFCEESDEQEAEEQTTKPQDAGSMGVTEKPPEEISKAPEEQQTPAGQAAGATEATAG